jgi:hypothetical protein
MAQESSCIHCGAPEKKWHHPADIALKHIASSKLFLATLDRCETCDQLWIIGLYEPWSAYVHAILWPGTEAQARYLMNDKEGATSLTHWHSESVRIECRRTTRRSVGEMGCLSVMAYPPKYEDLKNENGA